MSATSPSFVIPEPATVSLPVASSAARFPVARIFCVGRNYADHAREMGHDPEREPPFFFMKPATALVGDGADTPYPSLTTDLQHEVELVVALGRGGSDIAAADALSHVYGYAVGLDMTRRDLQGEAKKLGRPWDTGKAFDHSAPCSQLVPVAGNRHPAHGTIRLLVNGQTRQESDLSQMIWNVPDTIAYLSTLFALQAGDLIFTGTPSGVAAVRRGDLLVASVDGVAELSTRIA
jgi:fumarylpyruvate hydrolase